jgi:hypothetical protein
MDAIIPKVVDKDLACVRTLHPVLASSKQFDENWLQELLFQHPELLPVAEIDQNFGRLIPLVREFPVASGYIDVLYATADGSLCLVETKLWRNPEAHRTVLAQVLEYAKDLTRLEYAEFKAKVETAGRYGRSADLYQIMEKVTGKNEFDSIRFEQGIRRSLDTGSFLLLIVGDRIRPEVALLSEIIGTTPSLEFTLALVEIGFYHMDQGASWPVLAMPSVVGRSQEVTRAVVRIRYEEKRPEIEVTTIEERPGTVGRTNLEVFLKSLPSGLDEIFQPHLERWMAEPYTVYWGKVGFSLRYAPRKRLITIFDAYPTYISIIKEEWLPEWNNPLESYRAYREAVSSIPEIQRVYSRNGRYVYYEKMTLEEAQTLLEATAGFARTLVESKGT